MTSRADFERALDQYLADRADRLPDRVLEDALTEIDHTKQRLAWRVPWRFSQMPSLTKALAVGVAAIAIVVGGAWLLGRQPTVGPTPTASPTQNPTPTPSAASLPASGPALSAFESTLYGYSVQAPAAYQLIPATVEWPAGEALGPETEWTDRFRAGTNFVGIASQPVPDGTSSEEWLDAYAESVAARECAAPVDGWTPITIGTDPGRRVSFDCGGTAAIEYSWVVEGRGWVISGDASVVDLMMPTLVLP